MRTKTLSFFFLFALISAGPASADRYDRGLALYQHECTSCHSMGWKTPGPAEQGRRDLTRVVDSHTDAALRQWLEEPQRVKKDSGCNHRGLLRDQIDDLIKFFHLRASDPPVTGKPSSSGGGSGSRSAPSPRVKDSTVRRNGK